MNLFSYEESVSVRLAFSVFAGVLIYFFAFANIGSAQSLSGKQVPEDVKKKSVHPDLHQSLSDLYTDYKNKSLQGAADSYQTMQYDQQSQRVKVIIEAQSEADVSSVRSGLSSTDASYEGDYKNLVEASVPVSELSTVAEQVSNVDVIRPAMKPKPLKINTSDGVQLTEADRMHNNGVVGNDTKIAIIDGGFEGLSEAKTSGDIPDSVVAHTQDFTGSSSFESGGVHGTAVTEIVHDMAPGADLYLYKHGSSVDLGNAVDDAISRGVDVISYSFGWWNTNFYDGTGTIADIAARAHDNGVMFVNSAGNEAQNHWQGAWSDSDGNDLLNFSSGDELHSLGEVQQGDPIVLYMSWNAFPNDAEDYDLWLYKRVNQDSVDLVEWSVNVQSGDTAEYPTEALAYTSDTTTTYHFAIYSYDAPSKPDIEVYSRNPKDFEYNVESSSILAPGNDEKVVTVGAIDEETWTNGPQESFSSQGPTNESKFSSARTKPDIMGPDGVNVRDYNQFYGTSASAPHVAGAAALKLAANAGATTDQLETELMNSAIDMGVSGKDNIYGNGRLHLDTTGINTTTNGLQVTFNQINASNFPTINNFVTVTDSSGNPVTGLDASHFTVEEDSVDQTIQQVEPVGSSGSSIAAGLVLDRSGSMDLALSDAKNAANTFVNNMQGGDRGAVISFDSQVRIDQQFTTDKSALNAAIDGLSAGGNTAFYDAVVEALDRSNLQTGRQAVLALTDGLDNESTSTLQEVITKAEDVQIPVYTIGLGSNIDSASLKQLANESGGRYYQAPTSGDLEAIYEDISQQLDDQYKIVYETSNTQTDGSQRHVEVTATSNSQTGSALNTYTAPSSGSRAPIEPIITSTPRAGSQFWVDVKVGDSTQPVSGLYGTNFELAYDTTNLSVVEDTAGAFLGTSVNYSSNVLRSEEHVGIGIERSSGQGVDGDGVLARVKFEVHSNAPNDTPVEFDINEVNAYDPNSNPILLSPGTARDTIVSGLTVWPGDANNDGVVDQADVLPIGLFWDTSGPSRSNASTQWTGQQAPPWSPVAATYADADGSGLVDQADILPIGQHWGKTHQTTNQVRNLVTYQSENESSLGQLTVETEHVEGNTYRLKVIGEASRPLQGISFELRYDKDNIELQGSEAGDWMGSDPLQHINENEEEGRVGVGLSQRPSANPLTDRGVVAEFEFQKTGSDAGKMSLHEGRASLASGKSVGSMEEATLTSLTQGSVPDSYALENNYPNPFNPTTTIQYALPEAAPVQLTVYSVDGRKIQTLVDEQQKAGEYRVTFNADQLASGIYLYRIQTPQFNKTKQMMLIK